MVDRLTMLAGPIVAALTLTQAVGQTTRPDRAEPAPSNPGALTVHLQEDVSPSAPMAVLGGSTLEVVAHGALLGRWRWHLAWRNRFMSSGELALDDRGTGRFAVALPQVRVRARMALQMATDRRIVSRAIEVIPPAPLTEAAGRIRAMQLGVLDPTGRAQKALSAQRLIFADLGGEPGSRLRQDAFAGGAILLGGFQDPARLSEACRRLEARIEAGMIALVLAPPADWRQWGAGIESPDPEKIGPVLFAPALGRVLRPADMAPSRLAGTLAIAPPWRMLAWAHEDARAAGQDTPKSRTTHPLVAVRTMGRGKIGLAVASRGGWDPMNNALHRTLLNELVLWALTEYHNQADPSGGSPKGGRR